MYLHTVEWQFISQSVEGKSKKVSPIRLDKQYDIIFQHETISTDKIKYRFFEV